VLVSFQSTSPRGAAEHHAFSVGRSPPLATTAVPSPPLGKLTHTLWVLERFNIYRKYNRLYTCSS